MTPDEMTQVHAAAFQDARSWSAEEFAQLCAQPHVHAFTAAHGFALTRTLAGETELLTLAVHPDAQRRGTARALLSEWLLQARADAETAFLEVAADNEAAIALYASLSFTQSGLRKGYYTREASPPVDALLMTRRLQ